jgi:hypothetical protein
VKKNSFELLELEMVNLQCFFEKNGLGPLGVKRVNALYRNESSAIIAHGLVLLNYILTFNFCFH